MSKKNGIKICWLRQKHQGRYVCFIPMTIDGMGKTVGAALDHLETEACKIVSAVRRTRPKIKCSFTTNMVKNAVKRAKRNYVKYY